ncbi:uncharacterized protein MKK02DRAFT_40863 [Dioszegia hungarica]|uniref:DUF6534 domain-containing protein n=1 Tax=Dioszegia hungarica TaxID=4972 RepID=A0AA38H155_9TREE|nr:uncharacterized protein MKK02DRAFT_40863 [Dioszegia hungarica]KAI9632558.1 hypothetical protein MKK02DRAFT_40863 [Dioszegia hungarica]
MTSSLPCYAKKATADDVRAFLDHFLLGCVVCECIRYYRFIRTDKNLIVFIVVTSVACTLGHTVELMVWLSDIFVWSYGSFVSFAEGRYLHSYLLVDSICTVLVQTFYIDRAYRLHRHWWPLALLGPITILAFASGVVIAQLMAYKLTMLDPSLISLPRVQVAAYISNALSIVADAGITFAIVYGLHKNKTGWKHTDSHLKGLIIVCFEAQIPALFVAILTTIFWTTKVEIAILCLLVHTKVYCTGLLITLNFRSKPGSTTSVQSYSHRSHDLSGSHELSDIGSKGLGVMIQMETETASHQVPVYSKRSKVMGCDAEHASTYSTTTHHSRAESDHRFAQQEYGSEWDSTAALYHLPRDEEKGQAFSG